MKATGSDDDAALGVALDQVERHHQSAVQYLAGVEVDQRHVGLLDADDLRFGLLVLVQHLEHPTRDLEQTLLRVLLADRMGRLLVSSFQ